MEVPAKPSGDVPMNTALLPRGEFDIAEIERHVRRLRDQLASAWNGGCSPAVIRRLENELRLWWRRRDAARKTA
jgi:hypothetical protein